MERSYSRDFRLTSEHPDFEGHFPGHPVFPAVSQIDLAMRFLEEIEQKALRLGQVRRAKFRSVLRPDSSVRLKITILSETEAQWILQDEKQVYSSGELLFAPERSF